MMAMQPLFQELVVKNSKSYKAQSIVECRIAERDSTISKIFACNNSVSLIGNEIVSGEVKYSGRAIFTLVYENSEGKMIRTEYGTEFAHKLDNAEIKDLSKAHISLKAENTELKEINGNYVLSSIISADIIVYDNNAVKFLSGGEGIICKNEDIIFTKSFLPVKDSYEFFEEIECGGLNNILMHCESAVLKEVVCGVGCIICDGEINVNIIYTNGEEEEVKNITKLMEFRYEIPCDDAMPDMKATANCKIGKSNLSVVVDNSKNKSIIGTEIVLDLYGEVYKEQAINAISDLFSCSNEIKTIVESVKVEKLLTNKSFYEKVNGSAISNNTLNINSSIESITLEKLNIEAHILKSNKINAEGIVSATAIIKDEEGKKSSVGLELPFVVEVDVDGVKEGDRVVLSGIAHNVYARHKTNSEIEMEASLKLFASVYRNDYLAVITDISEGEELYKRSNALSVYIPKENDELWDLAKKLKETPENIMLYNGELQFPLSGEERIIVYRQQKIDY